MLGSAHDVSGDGLLRDRDGSPDVVLLVMFLVGVAALVAIGFDLYQAHVTIARINRAPSTDVAAQANAVSAVLTAAGGFINSVLLALSAFGAAVAGYQWTDAANKRAYAQPVLPTPQTVVAPQASLVAQVASQPPAAEAATDVEPSPKRRKKP